MMRPHAQPYLTREQELSASSDLLVLSHARLVDKMARQFAKYGVDREDLAQEGTIGLLIAASKFNRDGTNRFVTYAQWWVRAVMIEAVIRAHSVVVCSRSHRQKRQFFKQRPHFDVSLNEPLDPSGAFTVADTLVSPDISPEEAAQEALDGEGMSERIAAAVALLNAREADIIRRRFLGEEKEGLLEVAAVHGVSKERIRQIEAVALKKLGKSLSASRKAREVA